MSDNTVRDGIRNECIHRNLEVSQGKSIEMVWTKATQPINASIRKMIGSQLMGQWGLDRGINELGWRKLRSICNVLELHVTKDVTPESWGE